MRSHTSQSVVLTCTLVGFTLGLMGCNPTFRGTRGLDVRPCLQGDARACRALANQVRLARRQAGLLALGCTDGDDVSCDQLRSLRRPRETVVDTLIEEAKGCRQLEPSKCFALGNRFANRLSGVRKDLGVARAFYFRGCLRYDGPSCHSLGTLLRFGRGGPSSVKRAGLHYLHGCDLANGPSCYQLARLLEDYPGLIEEAEIRDLDERACILGQELSCDRLSSAQNPEKRP